MGDGLRSVLLFGGSGQVGQAFRVLSKTRGLTVHSPSSSDVDVRQASAVARAIAEHPSDLIVNATAYTAVDRAESDAGAAFALNALAPAIIAEEARRANTPLVHISTDYVFDGTKGSPYLETDQTAPLGIYGTSKRAGEMAVEAIGGRAVILRTAWVVSHYGGNFVKTMLRLGAERDALSIVADQVGTPTSADDICDAILKIGDRLVGDPDSPTGLYHFTNAGETTWYGLAEHLFEQAGRAGRRVPALTPIPTSAYPTPARRPADSRLSIECIATDFDVRPPHWQLSVTRIVSDLVNHGETQ